MRKKRMHTRIEKTAPLFADEFEKNELEKRADYFAGKSQVDEAELNKRMDEFSDLMTPGEAIKYMLKLGVLLFTLQATLTTGNQSPSQEKQPLKTSPMLTRN